MSLNRKRKAVMGFVLVIGMLMVSSPAVYSVIEEIDNDSFVAALENPKLAKRISVDLKEINVADVLKYLGEKAGVNVAVSKNVGGRVTLSFDDVSIRDALEITLLSNDLAVEKRGDILYVSTSEDYAARYGEIWGDAREVKMFKVAYAKSSEVLEILSSIKSSVGSVVVNDQSGLIVIMDTPDKIAKMKSAIATLDKESLTQIFELKYAKAKDIEDSLIARLDDQGVGSIKADERSNQVIVTALPGKMDEVEKIIMDLDQKTRQVLIEAKIVKVSLNPDFDMGIDWDYVSRNAGRSHATTIDMQLPVASTISDIGSLTVGTIGTDDYGGTIKALQTVGETNLLSSPRITAVNNEEAKILVGTKEAYITSTVTQGDTTTTTSESVTFLDVGVSLSVTPTINQDDFVTLKIKPEVSSVIRTLTTSEGNQIPIVDTTTAETTVMVKDGHTIIIGGLIKDETLRTTKKYPGFGDIPILGWLFKNVDEDIEKTELVVFLTPKILYGTEHQEDWEDDKEPKGLRGYNKEVKAATEEEKEIKASQFRGLRN